MKKIMKAMAVPAAVILTVFFISGCGNKKTGKGPVVVASKIDTEGALLGGMIVLILENSGFDVTDKTEFGPTDLIRKAITSDEIDIYPEYTGNGGFFFSGTDPGVWKNGEKGYEMVSGLDFEKNGLVWLTPSPASNTWAIAVREDVAVKNNLETLEDLGRYISSGGQFKLACSEEFVQRPDALPAFQQAYAFRLSKKQLLTFSGGNTALTEKTAAENTDGVNAAMAYGTDGALAALKLKVLEDSKGVQPVYLPAPVIRKEMFDRYPEIGDLLKPVFESLDLETLQSLNSQIAVEGQNAREVALNYLKAGNFLSKK